ncbi:iron ABC transporter substrate-binding protein [Dyadobacter endophyticus]|uniref:Iron ABC transporter substrate-binding protein n=1 Tax=Dyadobacter endophyticus TaxID=1749036 RepID=A0ABQ1ZA45_9BACT|nr:ABC transporter substrate-binding protein [Dyadobacter endophyticus]GGH55229.1 iron ABC transporter substrate-binding protein [Dyadobacter endophyticus]
MSKLPYLLILLTLLIHGCTPSGNEQKEQSAAADTVTQFVKTEIHHARGFGIRYFKDFKLVSIINPFGGQGDTLQYILQRKGAVTPADYSHAQRIEIPVKSLAAMSSMHIGLLGFLDAENVLTGLGSLQYVYSPKVIELIKAGKIAEVGRDQGLNDEKVIEMRPDLVMTVGNPGGKMDHYRTLREAGIPVMINSEWVEQTPLARAEWVKLMAALLDKEGLVNKKFAQVETEYERLSTLARKATKKPTVLSGMNTKDAWFMPAGNSYMARFFDDAGADYHWHDSPATGSLPLSFEAVYPFALQAEYWLNVGFDSRDTRRSIIAQDPRYADFKATQTGRVYSYNRLISDQGSNDFFESGSVNPHTVLADMIRIFHPDLLPDHQLVYYKQLPQ